MKKLALVATLLAALAPFYACADEGVAGRRVTAVGCHHVNAVCFVALDGAPFGASLGCTAGAQNQFRFDDGDTAIGRRSYASFMAAFLAGRPVDVTLSGCTGQGYARLAVFWVN